jgi:hypothetical protein
MGKILTYLGVEESSQTRDVLDAERLLEGMQTLYATAPQGNKRDSFSLPLAEMTKVFIEKVKGIKPQEKPQEKPVEKLGFDVGDRFYIAIRGKDKIYKIKSITFSSYYTNEAINEVEIEAPDGKKVTYKIDEVKKAFADGTWIKLGDELTIDEVVVVLKAINETLIKKLEEGGESYTETTICKDQLKQKFYIDAMNNIYNPIIASTTPLATFLKSLSSNDELQSNLINELYELRDENTEDDFYPDLIINYLALWGIMGEGLKGTYTRRYEANKTSYLNPKFFNIYQTPKPSKPSKPSASKFKVGDKVKIKKGTRFYGADDESSNPKDMVGEITRVEKPSERLNIKVKWQNGAINSYDTKDLELVSQEQPQKFFKEGDSYLVLKDTGDTTLTIKEVEEDGIKVKYADGSIGMFEIDNAISRVERGVWVKIEDEEKPQNELNFGDRFITADNTDLIFTIDFISQTNIGVSYADGLTAFINMDDFQKGLKSGYYKPYNESQQETDLYLKVGDEFLDKDAQRIIKIRSIDKSKNLVDYTILSKKGVEIIDVNKGSLITAQTNVKTGLWVKKDAKPTKPSKPTTKPTTPTTLTDKDKQIKHILDINIDDIDL